MKRFAIMLMICALMMSLLFSACGRSEVNGDDIVMPNNGDHDDTLGCDVFMTAFSYEEYQALIQQWQLWWQMEWPLPEDFKYFEDFAYLGEFESFHAQPPLGRIYYRYHILDQAQIGLILHIKRKPYESKIETEKLSGTDINPTDMRTLPSKQKGTYEINGLTYHYAMGELLYISWWRDGMYYELSSELNGDYPIEASTVYAKLLNIQAEAYPLMCTLLLKYEKS